MKNNDIDKIDEQIKSIMDTEKKIKNKAKDTEPVLEEEIVDTDTKKVDTIDEIEEENETEKTKELETIEDIKDEEDKEETVEEQEKNSEENSEEEKEKKKESKKIALPIIIAISAVLVIFIIILILLLPHKASSNKDKSSKNSKNKVLTKAEQKKVINGYGDALKGIVAVYFEKQNVLLEYDDATKLINYDYKVVCDTHEIYEDGNIYLNKCSIDGKKTTYSYGKKQEKEEPKINEDAIKVYVNKKTKKVILKEPSNPDDYDIYYFEIDGKYTDLTLLSDTSEYIFYIDEDYNVHMLNYKTGKKVLDHINYESVLPIKNGDLYDTQYIAVKLNNKWGIYNLSNNERVVAHQYDSVTPVLYMGTSGPASFVETYNDSVIAVLNHNGDYSNSEYGLIEYKTGKEVLKQEYKRMLKSGKYLWTVDMYDDGHIFDYTGKEYLAKNFDKIYWMVDGKFILVKDGENTKLVGINSKLIYDYEKVNLGDINYGLSYNEGALFQFNNPNAKESDYSDGCIEVIYDGKEKKGEVKTSYCGGIAKPVLYLYPKKTTKVTVSFDHPEFLQTTYPKYNGSWEVKAHPNGDLYDKFGAYYYALYWDEAKVHSVDFSTGYYVEKDNAIEFLEKKLAYIGLSRREANEFIMYWLPILEKNGKSLVYFELTEERDSYNKINITPKPDSLLRVVIHIKKVDSKVEIPKQSLTKLQRKGFVAVEWGGTTY